MAVERGPDPTEEELLWFDVALALANEARRRAIERIFGVSRDQANLLTLILLGMLLRGVGAKTVRVLRATRVRRRDVALGAAGIRELLYGVGGSSSRKTPYFAPLVCLALLTVLPRRAVRRTVGAVRIVFHWARLEFNHRYRRVVDLGRDRSSPRT